MKNEILDVQRNSSFDDFNDVNDEMLGLVFNLVSQYEKMGGTTLTLSGSGIELFGGVGEYKPPVSEDYLGQGLRRNKPKVLRWIKTRLKMLDKLESLPDLDFTYEIPHSHEYAMNEQERERQVDDVVDQIIQQLEELIRLEEGAPEE